MKTRLDLACRFWFPRRDRPVRYERGQRLPVEDDWRWHRHAESLYVDIPTEPGQGVNLHLPAPFFTWSAVTVQVLRFQCTAPGHVEMMFEINAVRVWGPAPWRPSELWQQITFDPPGNDEFPNRGPWWLRYRAPEARDLNGRMLSTLDRIHDYARHIDDDPLVVLAAVADAADEMRRELYLAALGGAR